MNEGIYSYEKPDITNSVLSDCRNPMLTFVEAITTKLASIFYQIVCAPSHNVSQRVDYSSQRTNLKHTVRLISFRVVSLCYKMKMNGSG